VYARRCTFMTDKPHYHGHLRCDAINQHDCVIGMLADMFAADNSQFKRERFTNACQPGANVRARS
jgi:hypothetical protein